METDKQIIHEAIKSIECPQDLNVVESSLIDEYHYFPYTDPRVNILGYPEIKHDKDEHDAVDLGLSVLWATCNIGATKPEEYGNHYAWGELETKESYSQDNYTYTDDPEILPASHDVATQLWGNGWRMPTKDEMDELMGLGSDWVEINGINCRMFSGTDQKSIILPAAGYWDGKNLDYVGSGGGYWSSSLKSDYPGDSDNAWYLLFDSEDVNMYGYGRYCGQSVRPVKQK